MEQSQLDLFVQCCLFPAVAVGGLSLVLDTLFGSYGENLLIDLIRAFPGIFNHEYRGWLNKQEKWHSIPLKQLSNSFSPSRYDETMIEMFGSLDEKIYATGVRYPFTFHRTTKRHNFSYPHRKEYVVWRGHHSVGLEDFRLFYLEDCSGMAYSYDLGVLASDENSVKEKILENKDKIDHWFGVEIDEDKIRECKVMSLKERIDNF